ncbi:hypothetical protein [Candidatus Borrarchaeum sp.]|uniref:hypothetical protein n=1 Tax=Candidatus Borrarchaeum sp. TaxID=2846742 RepID=UPI0025798D23|nr:hypothetical protein [Candidatus Borrarchaeum sp.]
MGEISVTNESEKKKIFFVRRFFDGIKFLLQTRETRYLLKLIAVLFSSMIITYTAISLTIATFGKIDLILRLGLYVFPFFLVLFLFILIELARFYWNDRKYNLFPEKNPLLKMKYWYYPDLKDRKGRRLLIRVGIFIFVSLLVLIALAETLIVQEILFALLTIYTIAIWSSFYLIFVLLFITAFIAAKGTMQMFEARYSEKFQQQNYWFFIFLPLPWILFISLLIFAGEIRSIFGSEAGFWRLEAQILYGFLCLIGIFTILKRNWRVGYTASQVSASLTFLTVIVIPGIIDSIQAELGTIISLIGLAQLDTSGGTSYYFLGPIISLIAMGFFYIQGALDDYGDKLRKYYAAWDKKLQEFNIKSEEDIQNEKYDKVFEDTPLNTDVPNAYRNSISGLILLLLTFFGIIFIIGGLFSVSGTAIGSEFTELFLNITSFLELMGLTLGLFVYTIIIVFRKQRKQEVISEALKVTEKSTH